MLDILNIEFYSFKKRNQMFKNIKLNWLISKEGKNNKIQND